MVIRDHKEPTIGSFGEPITPTDRLTLWAEQHNHSNRG